MTITHVIAWSLLALPLAPAMLIAADDEEAETTLDRLWHQSFRRVGRKLNCYFTLEKAELDLRVHPFDTLELSKADDIKSIDELLTRLRKETKGFTYERNKKNPAVIHVIDNRVREIMNYALERETSLTLTGVLSEISTALGKTFPDIGPKTSGDWREMGDDPVTKVSLKVEGQRVRDILTDAVPLDQYGPFVWRAETRTFGVGAGTMIQYFGPKTNKNSRYNYVPEER